MREFQGILNSIASSEFQLLVHNIRVSFFHPVNYLQDETYNSNDINCIIKEPACSTHYQEPIKRLYDIHINFAHLKEAIIECFVLTYKMLFR